MKCHQCWMENDEGAKKCEGCGHRLGKPVVPPERNSGGIADYFAFRKLVTPDLIRASYLIGAILITFGCIAIMGFPYLAGSTGLQQTQIVLVAIVVLIAGNLLWRMLCESAILMFSIHEVLVGLDDKARIMMNDSPQ